MEIGLQGSNTIELRRTGGRLVRYPESGAPSLFRGVDQTRSFLDRIQADPTALVVY
jgi:hypothetical protein